MSTIARPRAVAAARRRVADHALTAAIAGVATVSIAVGLSGAGQPSVAGLVAQLTGTLAGSGVAVMLLLMARVPLFERVVGTDRLTRWHARLGRSILILILVHAVAATISWSGRRGVDLVAAAREVLAMPGLAPAAAGTMLFCLVGAVSVRAARRRLSYEAWHLVHLSTYLAAGLAFAHQLAGPGLAGRPVVQIFWSLLYTVAYGLVLRFRVLGPVLVALRHRMRVERVIPERPGVVTIEIAGRHLDELGARAGQFLRWRFLTRATWHHANPFSLSAAPTKTRMRITVESTGAGTHALQGVGPGTRVLAQGPYGALTERRRTGAGVLLLAGGLGITPMRALFESLDAARGPVTLVHRVSTPRDVLFEDELRAIAERRGVELRLLVGPSTDPLLALTPGNLRRWAPGIADRDVFVCASPRFARAAREALIGAGVPSRRIHQEVFAL